MQLWQFWRPSAWADALGAHQARAWVSSCLCPVLVALLAAFSCAASVRGAAGDPPYLKMWHWGTLMQRPDVYLVCLTGMIHPTILFFWLRYAHVWGLEWEDSSRQRVKILGGVYEMASALVETLQASRTFQEHNQRMTRTAHAAHSDFVPPHEKPLLPAASKLLFPQSCPRGISQYTKQRLRRENARAFASSLGTEAPVPAHWAVCHGKRKQRC